MPSFEEILRGMADQHREQTPKILPEAAIARMREVAALYAAMLYGPRFAIGDLVTPRKGVGMNGHGEPYIVVDLRHDAQPVFGIDRAGVHTEGRRVDIRTMCITEGTVACFWGESWTYERYEPR